MHNNNNGALQLSILWTAREIIQYAFFACIHVVLPVQYPGRINQADLLLFLVKLPFVQSRHEKIACWNFVCVPVLLFWS